MAEEKSKYGDWRDDLTPSQQADFYALQNRPKPKYSSDVPIKKNDAPPKRVKQTYYPGEGWRISEEPVQEEPVIKEKPMQKLQPYIPDNAKDGRRKQNKRYPK